MTTRYGARSRTCVVPAHSVAGHLTFLFLPFPQFLERGTYGDVKKATWQDKNVAVKMFPYAERKGGFSEEVRPLPPVFSHFLLLLSFSPYFAPSLFIPPSLTPTHFIPPSLTPTQLVCLTMLHEHAYIVNLHGAHLGNSQTDRVWHHCTYSMTGKRSEPTLVAQTAEWWLIICV